MLSLFPQLPQRFSSWLISPRRVFFIFSGVSLTVCIVLLVITIRNIEHERSLSYTRIREHLDETAYLVTRQVESGVRQSRQELHYLYDVFRISEGRPAIGELAGSNPDVIRIFADPLHVYSQPDSLITYPPIKLEGTVPYPYDVLPVGTQLERGEDYFHACGYYERWRQIQDPNINWDDFHRDPMVVVEALFRLARNYAKDGRFEESLQTYGELSSEPTLLQVGLPAGLLSRFARCGLFHDLARTEERDREIQILTRQLENGEYHITYSSYRYFVRNLRDLLAEAAPEHDTRSGNAHVETTLTFPIDDAVDWIWQNWIEQRGTLDEDSLAVFDFTYRPSQISLCWAGSADIMVAIVAPTSAIIERYFSQLPQLLQRRDTHLQITDEAGQVLYGDPLPLSDDVITREISEIDLPWTLTLRAAVEDIFSIVSARRQTTLLVVIGMLVLAMLLSGYSLSRTITQELAVIKIKSDFINTVSHELLSPLTAIRQMGELLGNGRFQNDAERTYYLGSIQHETRRLQSLIEDLLSFRSMEMSTYRLDLQTVNIVDTVRRTIEDFQLQHSTEIDQISLHTSLPEISIRADQESLDRVIRNLLDNAVKYSPDEVHIDVLVSDNGDSVTIEITDRGIGIPEKEQEQIFEQFMRGQSAIDLHVKGTGIGLSIVRHIIEAHKGTIQVSSKAGKGSTFTISLPLDVDM